MPTPPLLDGHYELVRELGRGAMGVVWEARLPGHPAPLAAKLVQRTDAAALGRFRREAFVAQRVRHPHVVQVLDTGQLPDGTGWLVMELLRGESLDRRLARVGALPIPGALELLEQLLQGLEAIHAARVVHRDLKPANLQLEPGPGGERVKIVDFGVSRLLDEVVAGQAGLFVTAEGELSGTPQYVAPEALMEPGTVTPGHDVYACGVILHEALTGKLPYPTPKTLSDLLVSVVEAALPPLDRTCPARAPWPAPIEWLVRRLLEKDVALRPPDAAAARAVLAEARARLEGATRSRRGISERLRGWMGGEERP